MISSRYGWHFLDGRHTDWRHIEFGIYVGVLASDDLRVCAVNLDPVIARTALLEMDRREAIGEDVDRRHPFDSGPFAPTLRSELRER